MEHWTIERVVTADWARDVLVRYAERYGKGDFEVIREILVDKAQRVRDASQGPVDADIQEHWLFEKHRVPTWARLWISVYAQENAKSIIEVAHEAAVEKAMGLEEEFGT